MIIEVLGHSRPLIGATGGGCFANAGARRASEGVAARGRRARALRRASAEEEQTELIIAESQ